MDRVLVRAREKGDELVWKIDEKDSDIIPRRDALGELNGALLRDAWSAFRASPGKEGQ